MTNNVLSLSSNLPGYVVYLAYLTDKHSFPASIRIVNYFGRYGTYMDLLAMGQVSGRNRIRRNH